MARVVADSDDESEVITVTIDAATSQERRRAQDDRSDAEPPPSTLERDPLTAVNFDDYLSPTQRLSSAITTEDPLCSPADFERQSEPAVNSSTDRFLNEVAPLYSTLPSQGEATQALSYVEEAVNEMGHLKKRSYSQTADQSSDTGHLSKKSKPSEPTATVHAERPHPNLNTVGVALEQAHRPGSAAEIRYQPYKSRTNHYANNANYGTTMLSSVGGHQSLNIDPNSLGMNFDEINPFGRLSQISAMGDGDIDSEETRGISEIFRNAAANSGNTAATKVETTSLEDGNRFEHVTNFSVAPVQLMKSTCVHPDTNIATDDADDTNYPARVSTPDHAFARQPSESSPSFSPISNRAESAGPAPTPPDTPGPDPVKAAPKKRGRKPKQKQMTKRIDILDHDDVDELQMEECRDPRETRASTVDSFSNISEVSAASIGSKKRNRAVKKAAKVPDSEAQPKKLPSSDLSLNDKAIIGLSPERYKPRPSKRRGRNTQQDIDIEREVKLIEAVHQQLDSQPKAEDVDTTNVTKSKGKRGRKSKAHERNKEDENRADVELELKHATDEDVATVDPAHPSDEEKNHVDATRLHKVADITIDVPPLSKPGDSNDGDTSLHVSEPKKRGRNKKQKPAVVVETEDIKTDDEYPTTETKEEHTAEDVRPALVEKDVNAPLSSTRTGKSKPIIDSDDEQPQSVEDVFSNTTKVEPKDEETVDSTGNSASASASKSTSSATSVATTTSSLFTTPYRVGLSRRRPIPSLLRKVDRNKELPKAIEHKEKLTAAQKRQREKEDLERQEALENGEDYISKDELRDADGRLVEWDF